MVTEGTRVYFSTDGARSWHNRQPPDQMFMASSFKELMASELTPGEYFIVGHPLFGRYSSEILHTSDSGLNWSLLPAIPVPVPSPAPIASPSMYRVDEIALNPINSNEILVSTSGASQSQNRLWKGLLGDGSIEWEEIPCPHPCIWSDGLILDIEFDPSGNIWALSGLRVIRSNDNGSSWTVIYSPNLYLNSDLAINPNDETEVTIAGYQGLAFTTDNGESWEVIQDDFVPNGSQFPSTLTAVAYDPHDPELQLVSTSANGVFRRLNLPSGYKFIPSSKGMNAHTIRALQVVGESRVHAGMSDSEILSAAPAHFIRPVEALSWSPSNDALEADNLRAIAVDPNNPNVVYAGGLFFARLLIDGQLPSNGGIYKSIDGGLSWATIDNGIPNSGPPAFISRFGLVRDIQIDVFSASPSGDSQIIYAVGNGSPNGSGSRIYKSYDSGETWVEKDNGIGGTEPNWTHASAVQIVQDISDVTGNTLYVSTFFDYTDPEDILSIPNGVFKTTDGGDTWVNFSNGLPRLNGLPENPAANVLSLAYDSTDITGQTLYASVNGRTSTFEGVVYKTTNGGESWFFAGNGLGHNDVRDLLVDPQTGDVYAAIVDPNRRSRGNGGIFVSKDGGASWFSMNVGLPAYSDAYKLALDNSGPNSVVYAGTSQGVQTFKLLQDDDADGVSNLVESGAPYGGDGNEDGVLDQIQSNVASLLVSHTTVHDISSYITASVKGLAGNCSALQDVSGLEMLDHLPPEDIYEAPFSGLRLRIPDCERAQVELIYHNADFASPSYEIRAYWPDFPDESNSSWHAISSNVSGERWTFELIDGARGDASLNDGVIIFQGAAKRLVEVIFRDGMEAE